MWLADRWRCAGIWCCGVPALRLAVAHIGDAPDNFMPKGKNAKMLTPDQIGLIRAWIDQGAK